MKKKFLFKLSPILFTLTLFVSVFALPPVAKAEDAPNCDINAHLNYLLNIRDNTELSEDAKSELESQARRKLLETVISCSLSETQEVKEQLSLLENLNEEETAVYNYYQEQLDSFIRYYEEQKILFAEIDDPQKIKEMAQKILEWRSEEYNPSLNDIIDFIFLFKQQTVIGIADNRLSKIKTSLNGIFSFNNQDINLLLTEATDHIIKAKELRESAYNHFFTYYQEKNLISEEIATTTPTSTIPEINLPEETLASSTTPFINQEPTARELIRDSLENIKEAYSKFFELSRLVKEIFGF